ncbi:MAG: GlsB/YeaQ/YmgE family stress response membrane protein [Patescibacteria group bacterium]|nr:GlsB/YeaQ/YmgE family stress response membrane protein [Patescibacteria group bacterium]
MDIILWIVLGAIAGFLASVITKSSHGLLTDVILGIIGGFLGGLLMNLLGQPGVTGFNLYSVFVAVVGAVILIFLGRVVHL